MSAAIELRDVRKSFGATEIIRGVNLSIADGERHAVIGPNGAGKSTLYNLITGKYSLSGGDILLRDEVVSGLAPFQINRKGLSRSFQVTNIFPRMSVYENIRCGVLWSLGYKYSFWHNVDNLKDVNDRTVEILEEIGMQARAQIPAGVLTYAEQRALEIGITIEPTAGMSHSETDQAIALIRKVTEGRTLVMVEHDMGVVFGLADKISVLVYGEIIASGTPEEIKGNAAVKEAYLGEEVED